MRKAKFLVFSLMALAFAGCTGARDDDDLNTVPVTNNPNMIRPGLGPKTSFPMR